jgi:hypothetical protein
MSLIVQLKLLRACAVEWSVNTENSPMKDIADKVNALIKSNIALHVVRTSAAVGQHRAEFASRQEADVARCQAELTATLHAIFYPSA